MSDIQEIALAASAFLLASAVFRWNGSPKHGADRTAESVAVIVAQFMFKECHDFIMANTEALQDEYYESEAAIQQLSELDHAYPEPTVHPPASRSNEDDHFTYAGSSCGEALSQYDALDHMFELDRKRARVRQIHVQPSTSQDHFSYAATAFDEEDLNELHHSRIPSRVARAAVVPRSTANDHFSYAASSFEEDDSNEYDHSNIEARVGRSCSRSHSTARDHFSYAASSFDEDDTNEYDHSQIRPREHREIYPHSTSTEHFSYIGSCPDVEVNEYDHFHYSQPLCAAY
jgi:hypothetical protein